MEYGRLSSDEIWKPALHVYFPFTASLSLFMDGIKSSIRKAPCILKISHEVLLSAVSLQEHQRSNTPYIDQISISSTTPFNQNLMQEWNMTVNEFQTLREIYNLLSEWKLLYQFYIRKNNVPPNACLKEMGEDNV